MAGAVRQPIDIPSFEEYISAHVQEIKLPIQIKQFGFGQSNPTYQLLSSNGHNYVMRKKPPGKLLSKTAHQVEREYRIINALENTDVPVPKAYHLCEDSSVIGTPFYIMEFLDGRIFQDPSMPDVTPRERTEMWHDAIRTLAKFHRVDPAAVWLEDYGKSTGFYDRQIKTFSKITNAQAAARDIETDEPVGQMPHIEEILAFFKDPKTQPKDRTNLVHGDYKIDNLVFHRTEPRVIGILDWEMSTTGHPLSDLTNLLMPYLLQNHLEIPRMPQFPATTTPGLPSKQQLIKWYEEIAGWYASPDLPWGSAFAVFRLTCIFQGIAARYALRQASSVRAKETGEQRKPMGELAWWFIMEARRIPEGDRSRL